MTWTTWMDLEQLLSQAPGGPQDPGDPRGPQEPEATELAEVSQEKLSRFLTPRDRKNDGSPTVSQRVTMVCQCNPIYLDIRNISIYKNIHMPIYIYIINLSPTHI